MSLSYDEHQSFLDLSRRDRDLVRALHRCYTAWHARQYAVTAGFLVGTTMFVAGLFSWWGLSILGLTIALASSLAAILHVRRLAGMRRDLPSPRRHQGWKGLMG